MTKEKTLNDLAMNLYAIADLLQNIDIDKNISGKTCKNIGDNIEKITNEIMKIED